MEKKFTIEDMKRAFFDGVYSTYEGRNGETIEEDYFESEFSEDWDRFIESLLSEGE